MIDLPGWLNGRLARMIEQHNLANSKELAEVLRHVLILRVRWTEFVKGLTPRTSWGVAHAKTS